MSFAVAVVGGLALGAMVYSSDKQRKLVHQQQDAINAAQAQDAKDKTDAETSAAVAANATLQDAKRRRRSSTLGLGAADDTVDALGGPSAGSVLAGGGSARVGSGVTATGGSALGAGAVTSPAAGGSYSRTPKALA